MWTGKEDELYCRTKSKSLLYKMLKSSLPVLFENGTVIEAAIATEEYLHAKKAPEDAFDSTEVTFVPVVILCKEGERKAEIPPYAEYTISRDVSSIAQSIITLIDYNEVKWKRWYVGWSKAYYASMHLKRYENDVGFLLRNDYHDPVRLYIALT